MRVAKLHVAKITRNAELLKQHEQAAHDYMKQCLEIYRNKCAVYRQLCAEYVPGLSEAEDRYAELTGKDGEITELRRQIKLQRQRKRKRVPATDEQRQRLDELLAEKKELKHRLDAMREEFRQMVQPWRDEYERRCSGASHDLIRQLNELGRQLKQAKKQKSNPDVTKIKRSFEELKARKKQNAPKTNAMAARRAEVLGDMLAEDWPELAKRVALLDHRADMLRKQAQRASGVYQGTYVAISGPGGAVEVAVKNSRAVPRDPPWTGGRKVGVQIQKATTLEEVMGGQCTALRMRDITGERATKKARVATGRRADRRIVAFDLRVGTDEQGHPIWVSGEALMHRQLRMDARVRWAYLVPEQSGNELRHSLQLTLDVPSLTRQRRQGTNGTAHVRLKWSLEQWMGEDRRQIVFAEVNGVPMTLAGDTDRSTAKRKKTGRRERSTMPAPGVVTRYMLAERCRASADVHFDVAKERLREWMAEHPDLVPEWMTEATSGIDKWRRHGKLAKVALRWRDRVGIDVERLWKRWREHRDENAKRYPHNAAAAGDYFVASRQTLDEWLSEHGVRDESERMFVWLEWWRRKDLHLKKLETANRRRAIERRNYEMRMLALMMAEHFERVEVDAIEIPKMARRRAPEQNGDELHRAARYQRVVAAPGTFKAILKEVLGADRFSEVERERPGDADAPGTSRKAEKQPSEVDAMGAAE